MSNFQGKIENEEGERQCGATAVKVDCRKGEGWLCDGRGGWSPAGLRCRCRGGVRNLWSESGMLGCRLGEGPVVG